MNSKGASLHWRSPIFTKLDTQIMVNPTYHTCVIFHTCRVHNGPEIVDKVGTIELNVSRTKEGRKKYRTRSRFFTNNQEA